MILAFFQNSKLNIQESCTMTVERPSKRIQKVRGLIKVAQRVGGKTE